MSKKERFGFTLIELLICVSIIGILAALLLPGLSRAKRKAKEVVCMNNQKQLGTAIMMWSKDNKMRLPLGYHEQKRGNYFLRDSNDYILSRLPPDEKGTVFLGHLVEDEIVSEQSLFVCPFKGGSEFYTPNNTRSWVLDYTRKFSLQYYSNAPLHKWWNGNTIDYNYRKITEFSPGQPILADVSIYSSSFLKNSEHASFAMNVLYIDGHVSRKPYSEYASVADLIAAQGGPANDGQIDDLWEVLGN